MIRAALVFAALLLLVAPAAAHHGGGTFDGSKEIKLTGTFTGLDLINPHSWIYLEVKDDKGQPTVWALEATNPLGLQRNGIKREDVRPGDAIKVRCHLLRDGSNGCLLGYVTPFHGDPARGHGVEKEWD